MARPRTTVVLPVVAVLLGLAVLLATTPAHASTGIDVSRWQHPYGAAIDWSQVRAAGHRFAFVKATDPVDGTNPYFTADWAAAAGVGLYRGAYHRARPGESLPEQQASQFVAVVGSSGGPLDLPPVLDLEESGGLAPAALVSWSQRWLETVSRLTGRRPILYTGYYFWQNELGSTTTLNGYRLWLPQYTTAPAPYLVPSAWPMWTFWQHSNTGTVPGITGPVDLNRFCCSDGNLAGLAGTASGEAAGNPFGVFDQAAGGPGIVSVSGWALDPDTTGPVGIHIYVDGRFAAAVTASGSRPDVGAAFPGFGSNHGFTAVLPGVPGGTRSVCAYALNTASGTGNPLIGCHQVRVPTGNPIGTIDDAVAGPGHVDVRGWAIDPDTAGPIDVHLYAGAVGAAVRADGSRPDVGAFFTAYGPNHGFTARVTTTGSGPQSVCAYGINTGSGVNTLLGCRPFTPPGGNPFGVLDEVSAGPGQIRTRGWVIDPDTSQATNVHVYIDNRAVAAAVAADDRPDVGAAYAGYGSAHGFSTTHAGITRGPHTVCVYAINLGTGATNPLVGCRTVTVP